MHVTFRKQTSHAGGRRVRRAGNRDPDLLLPAGSAAGSSAGIVFTHGPILEFFDPQGLLTGLRSSLPNFTLIGSGVGVYYPQH